MSVSLGASKSQSNQHSSSDSARGSRVTAGGDVSITAKGAGKDSDILIQGSEVQAGGSTRLKAEDEVQLLAAQNTQTESNSQSSKSGSIGVTFAASGISATASASRGKGAGAGQSTSYTNTQVSGQQVSIESGGDTALKGAVVQGEQVAVNVGGNLTIESLQDSSHYSESSKSAGLSVSVPITGGNIGGSVSAGKTSVNSNYQSVSEQSAIRAGDGGFDVNVKGKTNLTGGAITSSEQAVQEGKNRFSSEGGLSISDVQNTAAYQAEGYSVSAGVSGMKGGSAGAGSAKGSAGSTTQAAISGVAGNTAARTGDVQTGIEPIFNKEQVKQEVAAQVAITAAFFQQAPKAWADHAESQQKAALARGDQAEAQKWAEGGAYRSAGHTLIGALGGGLSGATGALLSASAMPEIGQLIDNTDLPTPVKQALGMVTSATLGVVAGTAGAAAAFGVDTNNRQLHPGEKQRIKDLAKGDAQKEARLTAAACALVKCYAEYPEGSSTYNALKALADAGSSDAMSAERQQLQAQQGLYNYSNQGLLSDQNVDAAKQFNNTYQVTTRAMGAGQAVLGGLGVAGSVVTAPASCATGVGCVANAVVGTLSADQALTGAKQAVSGLPENTSLNSTLQALGLSPEAAGYAEAALGIGAAAKAGSVVNTVTASQAANNAAAKLSYEDIAKFGAKGLIVTPEVMQTPQARALISEYQAAGVPAERVDLITTGVLKTGNALPVVRTVSGNEELIKVVPKNVAGSDGVGAFSPYFMTRSEYDALSKLSPAEIGQRLGLPAEQSVRGAQLGFEAYTITPKPGTAPKVFTSTVAPVEQGGYKAVGGAQQTIVPNRSLWTEPKPLGTIGDSK